MTPILIGAFASSFADQRKRLRNVPGENQAIADATKNSQPLINFVPLAAATVDSCLEALRTFRDRVVIFHFAGHANGYQIFLEEAEKKARAAWGGGLARYLGCEHRLHLVFLNACSTLGHVEQLRQAGIPVVIATAQAVKDEIAREFAKKFYASLVAGATIGGAFHEATAAIETGLISGDTRELFAEPVDGPGPHEQPWIIVGSEEDQAWTLRHAVDDPYFGLPDLPDDLNRLWPESPYRGLEPYQRDHARVFFGRGNDLRRLYERIRDEAAHQVILCYGQSGVGKSSLLAAGLRPRLEASLNVRYIRRDPRKGLLDSTELPLLFEGRSLRLGEALRAIESDSRPLVLVLDQFEEVFTKPLQDHPRELSDFARLLGEALADPDRGPLGKIILAFRKEWLPEIESVLAESEIQVPASNKVFIQRLDREGILESVRLSVPVRKQYALEISQDLPVRIAESLLADADAPVAPTLQLLLSTLWDLAAKESPSRPRFDDALYSQVMRAALDLGRFFDDALVALREKLREAVDSGLALDVLMYHTRDLKFAELRTREELRRVYEHRWGQVARVLEECKQPPYNLLVDASAEREDVTQSTRLAHDVVASIIAARFRDSDLPGQRTRRILDAKSPDWRRAVPAAPSGDREGAKNEADEPTPAYAAEPRAVLDDADLRTVERGLNATRLLDESEKSLVDASREAREKRRSRSRFWKRIGVVAIAAITILSCITTWQWREATIQSKKAENSATTAAARARVSRALYASSEARRILGDEPTLGLLLSVEAMRSLGPHDPALPEPERALRSVLRSPARQVLRSPLFREDRLAISFHKRWLAAAGFGGHARIWDLSRGTEAATARELQGFEDESSISCLVISSNEEWLASGSDWGARLWRIRDGVPVGGAIELAKESVTAVVFSRDGRWLATAGDKVQAWKLEGADQHLRLPPALSVDISHDSQGNHTQATCMSISPDGRWLVATSLHPSVRVWDLNADDPAASSVVLQGHTSHIDSLAMSHDSKWFVTGSRDHTIRKWSLPAAGTTSSIIERADGEEEFCRLAVTTDDSRLISARGATIRLRNLSSGTVEGSAMELKGQQSEISSLEVSQDGRWLVTGGLDGTVRIWDFGTEVPSDVPMEFRGHRQSVNCSAISSDSSIVATAGDGTVRLWGLADDRWTLRGYSGWVTSMAISPDNRWLVTGCVKDDVGRIWDLSSDRPSAASADLAHGAILCLAFDAKSQLLATGGMLSGTGIWDFSANPPGRFLSTPDPENSPGSRTLRTGAFVRWLGFTENHLITVGDDKALIWTLKDSQISGEPIELKGHSKIAYASLTPDNRRLVTGSEDATVRIWNLTDLDPGKSSLSLKHGDNIGCLAVSGDGHWLITGDVEGVVRIWDLRAADPSVSVMKLKEHSSGISCIAISPDSRWLATGSGDHTARLWKLNLADPASSPVVLHVAQSNPICMVFTPDNRRLVEGTVDGMVRSWDFTDGDPASHSVELTSHRGPVRCIAVSPNGRFVITGGEDRTAIIHRMRMDELMAEAKDRAGRNMTVSEWNRFFPGEDYRVTFPDSGDLPKPSRRAEASVGGTTQVSSP